MPPSTHKSASAQMILFMDSVGTIRAEMPGINGFRQKIDLPHDFAARNPEITIALRNAQFQNDAFEREQREIEAHEAKKKKDAKIAIEREARLESEKATARKLYGYVAEKHNVALANRVVPDKDRRPRAKIVIFDLTGRRVEISPRNPKFDAIVNGAASARSVKSKNEFKFTKSDLEI